MWEKESCKSVHPGRSANMKQELLDDTSPKSCRNSIENERGQCCHFNTVAINSVCYMPALCAAFCLHLGCQSSTNTAEMRKRQQPQNEGTPAVSQAPGNQRPNNTCCFCWCCCCSCSCLTVRNEERAETAERPTHTTKMESIQILEEEGQNPTSDEVLSWSQNFDKMMKAPAGRNLFREFLRTEYSEENLLFWLACEDLKKEQNKKVIEEKARTIYDDYISILSPKEVSLDSRVREVINRNLLDPNPHMYEDAQLQIYTLMHRDSFPRFLNSQIYKSFLESTASSTSES